MALSETDPGTAADREQGVDPTERADLLMRDLRASVTGLSSREAAAGWCITGPTC